MTNLQTQKKLQEIFNKQYISFSYYEIAGPVKSKKIQIQEEFNNIFNEEVDKYFSTLRDKIDKLSMGVGFEIIQAKKIDEIRTKLDVPEINDLVNIDTVDCFPLYCIGSSDHQVYKKDVLYNVEIILQKQSFFFNNRTESIDWDKNCNITNVSLVYLIQHYFRNSTKFLFYSDGKNHCMVWVKKNVIYGKEHMALKEIEDIIKSL